MKSRWQVHNICFTWGGSGPGEPLSVLFNYCVLTPPCLCAQPAAPLPKEGYLLKIIVIVTTSKSKRSLPREGREGLIRHANQPPYRHRPGIIPIMRNTQTNADVSQLRLVQHYMRPASNFFTDDLDFFPAGCRFV